MNIITLTNKAHILCTYRVASIAQLGIFVYTMHTERFVVLIISHRALCGV